MSVSSVASDSPIQARPWSRIAERGSLWGMKFTAWCYRIGGRRVSLVLVHAIVAYFFLTDRAGRRASAAYLARVHATPAGRAALGRPPGLWQSFQHFRCFALAIVDRLAIWFGRADAFTLEVEGFEHIERLEREGRGAIVIGAHLGSFDAMRLLAMRKKSVVNVLMFTAHAQRINQVLREICPDADTRVIHTDPDSVSSVFEIRACLERGEHVAILGDRVEPCDRQRALRVPLLGDPAELPQAPFLLAGLLGCPVILMLALRQGPGHYAVRIEELADRVRVPRGERSEAIGALVQAYAARLEHYCTRAPYQWFNFFDYWGDAAS